MGTRRHSVNVRIHDRRSAAARKRLDDEVGISGKLTIILRGPDGRFKARRVIHNAMGTNGKAHIADQLSASPGEAAMGWMAIGTGTPTGTALGNELDKNACTSITDSGDVVTYVGDWAAGDGTGAITEAGVFNNASPSTGTMLCSASFSVINKGASDTLQINWDLTIS
jgi:hypothetical protein